MYIEKRKRNFTCFRYTSDHWLKCYTVQASGSVKSAYLICDNFVFYVTVFLVTLSRELQSIDYALYLHNLNRHKTYFKNIYQILIINY